MAIIPAQQGRPVAYFPTTTARQLSSLLVPVEAAAPLACGRGRAAAIAADRCQLRAG